MVDYERLLTSEDRYSYLRTLSDEEIAELKVTIEGLKQRIDQEDRSRKRRSGEK